MKRRKERPITEVVTRDLKALLHWAAYGVEHAEDGSYASEICEIVRSYAKTIRFQVGKPEFGKYIRRKKN